MKLTENQAVDLSKVLSLIRDAWEEDASVHHSMSVTFICTLTVVQMSIIKDALSYMYSSMLKE